MNNAILISIFDSIPTWVMITPIIFCSIILLAVFIERIIFYKKVDIDYRLLIESVSDNVKKKKVNDAKLLCNNYFGPIVKMIILFLDRIKEKEDKEILIKDISEKAIRSIEKYGGVISTIATVSPMMGLLGTVTGMMKSFSGLAKMGPSARVVMAQGITEALITTALGLLVAIPSIMFYNFMVSKVNHLIREVEFIANNLTEL